MAFVIKSLGLRDQTLPNSLSIAKTTRGFIVTAISSESHPMILEYDLITNQFSEFSAVEGRVIQLYAGTPLAALGFDHRLYINRFPSPGWIEVPIKADRIVQFIAYPNIKCIYIRGNTLQAMQMLRIEQQTVLQDQKLTDNVDINNVIVYQNNEKFKVYWLDQQGFFYSRLFDGMWQETEDHKYRGQKIYMRDQECVVSDGTVEGIKNCNRFSLIGNDLCYADEFSHVRIGEQQFGETSSSIYGVECNGLKFFVYYGIDSGVWCLQQKEPLIIKENIERKEEDSSSYY